MATKRLKKGESPLSRVEQIERRIAAWRTRLKRATTELQKLEKQRAYYVRKAVELGQ